MEKPARASGRSVAPMPTKLTYATVYCAELEPALPFYRDLLGFEVRDDVDLGSMRWLTVGAPGQDAGLLLAATDQHIPPVDQEAMRTLIAKGTFPVFLETKDVDTVFERLRGAGVEVLQEPIDQAYGLRDCAVRDPAGNHVRIGSPVGVGS